MPDRTRARELATRYNAEGDPYGWFEVLYREAEEGKSEVPWADLRPNPHLLSLWNVQPLEAAGKKALVVGSGFGDDAEQLACWGFRTTAFDVSETAIRAARRRFPTGNVEYITADLFVPPPAWLENFDFVLEAYTLQVFPAQLRRELAERISSFVAPGGLLLVIARGREESEPAGKMPWPVTRAELEVFTRFGLEQRRFDDYADAEEPAVRRFLALYQRA